MTRIDRKRAKLVAACLADLVVSLKRNGDNVDGSMFLSGVLDAMEGWFFYEVIERVCERVGFCITYERLKEVNKEGAIIGQWIATWWSIEDDEMFDTNAHDEKIDCAIDGLRGIVEYYRAKALEKQ